MTYIVEQDYPLPVWYLDGLREQEMCNMFCDYGPFEVDGIKYTHDTDTDDDDGVYARNMFDIFGDYDTGQSMHWTANASPGHPIKHCHCQHDYEWQTWAQVRKAHENLCAPLQTPYDGRSSP